MLQYFTGGQSRLCYHYFLHKPHHLLYNEDVGTNELPERWRRMMTKNRWIACLCVCGLLCGVLCACRDVKPTVSEPSSALPPVSTTTISITTTEVTTTTTTTEMTTTTTMTTTETRSSAITSTTAKPVPADKHPTADQQKCYVNFLGERVLVSHTETVWREIRGVTTHYWVYHGQLTNGDTLRCQVDAKTGKITEMSSDSPFKPGWIKEETAVDVALAGFKKWGFNYKKEDVTVNQITRRKSHPDEPLSNFYRISGGTENDYIIIIVALTEEGVRATGAILEGMQMLPQWITA